MSNISEKIKNHARKGLLSWEDFCHQIKTEIPFNEFESMHRWGVANKRYFEV